MTRPPCLALLLLGCIAACDDVHRGGEGESCTRRDDCQAPLRCVSQVCVAGDDAGAPAASAPGSEGDPCGARNQCGTGLACVENACTPAPAGLDPSSHLSGLGESCRASNDCMADLACLNAVCARVTLPLDVTPKQCHRVECAEDAECCAAFVPDANCASYAANCEADPVFCNTYRSLCECSLGCEDELCVPVPPGCMADGECTSQQTPFCVEGACVQCNRDAACPGEGTKCVEGVCMAACEIDEQCPPFHACQDGACVEVGCQSDRECVFMTSSATSVCQEGTCETPCAVDSDCGHDGARFEVCSEGRCVFVGCESDAECRALLGPFTPDGHVRAVCR